jgi:hypothetical protein
LATVSAIATSICHLVCSFFARCAVVKGIVCVSEIVIQNEATWNHEASATLLKGNVLGNVCASGREGFVNASVSATGPLGMESARAF